MEDQNLQQENDNENVFYCYSSKNEGVYKTYLNTCDHFNEQNNCIKKLFVICKLFIQRCSWLFR
jgi:hypothetical protein